jgi:polyisoprenoid-binding protein YceI
LKLTTVTDAEHKNFLKKRIFAAVADGLNILSIMNRQPFVIVCAILAAATFAHASTLEVDQERSRIQVDAKATGHNFTGNLKKFTTTVSGDATSLKPDGFELKWGFKDLSTDDEKRDKEMIKWLGEADPKGSFKFIKSWTDDAGKTHGMGTLTIHGVSKTISFPYTASKKDEWVTIDGTVSMDYQNFKLPLIRAMAVMTVDPKLSVRFHVVGKVK